MKRKTLSPEKSISGLSEQVFSQGEDGGRGEGEPLEHLKITLSWLHPVENQDIKKLATFLRAVQSFGLQLLWDFHVFLACLWIL